MILSEQAARTRWCPFVRAIWADFDGEGRYTTRNNPTFNVALENHGVRERRLTCVGPGCMSWRSIGNIEIPATDDSEPRSVAYGYCGLAGRPMAPAEALDLLGKHLSAIDPEIAQPEQGPT